MEFYSSFSAVTFSRVSTDLAYYFLARNICVVDMEMSQPPTSSSLFDFSKVVVHTLPLVNVDASHPLSVQLQKLLLVGDGDDDDGGLRMAEFSTTFSGTANPTEASAVIKTLHLVSAFAHAHASPSQRQFLCALLSRAGTSACSAFIHTKVTEYPFYEDGEEHHGCVVPSPPLFPPSFTFDPDSFIFAIM
jgi:hypothetical protein